MEPVLKKVKKGGEADFLDNNNKKRVDAYTSSEVGNGEQPLPNVFQILENNSDVNNKNKLPSPTSPNNDANNITKEKKKAVSSSNVTSQHKRSRSIDQSSYTFDKDITDTPSSLKKKREFEMFQSPSSSQRNIRLNNQSGDRSSFYSNFNSSMKLSEENSYPSSKK